MHPTMSAMPDGFANAVRRIAERLSERGYRAWLVGGAVRDLALGIEPQDADLCSAAHPEEVEALFDRTHAVGKAFGTVLVLVDDIRVQVTTFRSEGAYSDARRPDEVRYGTSLEEDARRRDFTCNALFLDPLDGELADPEGGLADLEAGRLRCVGDARERFAEDGLRLLRLARFAARFDLAVEEPTLAAARGALDALRGVSAERILAELQAIAEGPRPARAVAILGRIGVWEQLVPGAGGAPVEALERLGAAPGAGPFLALALAPLAEADREGALGLLRGLRAPRALQREVLALWSTGVELEELAARSASARRCERVRLVREPTWPAGMAVWEARFPDARCERAGVAELLAFAAALGEDERFPEPWIRSAELEERGVERGPRWGALLREAEDLRLDGVHTTRDEALAWLETRLRS